MMPRSRLTRWYGSCVPAAFRERQTCHDRTSRPHPCVQLVAMLLVLAFSTVPYVRAAEVGKLIVMEAGAQGVAIGNQQAARVQFTLTVHNASTAEIPDVRVQISDLRDAALTARHQVHMDGANGALPPFPLKPHESRTMSFASALPEVGVYSARLLVSGRGEPLDIPITVTRVSAAKTEIAPLKPAAVRVGPFGRGGEFKQDLLVRRAGGTDTSLTVRLEQLEYAPKDNVKFVVPSASLSSPMNPVTVPGVGESHVPLVLHVPRAGAFEAKFEHQLAGTAPAISPVTIYAREPRWVAALFILLGVLIATVLRRIVTVLKPRALAAQRLAACRERLEHAAAAAHTDPAVLSAIDRVGVYLQQQWEVFLRAPSATAEAVLEEAERKVRLLEEWMHSRAALAAGLPESVRRTALATLHSVQHVIENVHASSTEVQQQLEVLGKLPGETDKLAREFAATTIAALAEQLSVDSSAEAEQFRKELAELATRFKDADAAGLAQLFTDLHALRLKYVRWIGAALAAQLQDEPPVAMDGVEWLRIKAKTEPLLEEVARASDPDLALGRYLAAVRTLTYPLILHLMATLSARIAAGGEHKTQYEHLHQRAVLLRDQLASNQLSQALKLTEQLISDFTDLEYAGLALLDASHRHAFTRRTVRTLKARREEGWSFLELSSSGWFADGAAPPIGTAAAAGKQSQWLGIAAIVLALLITVLLGLQTLWSNDWTWGGTNAYLLAILWGAGVYGFSFESLNGLINRYKS